MSRSRVRLENLGAWLRAIVERNRWPDPTVNDMTIATAMWMIGPLIAIDPWKLFSDNDNPPERSE